MTKSLAELARDAELSLNKDLLYRTSLYVKTRTHVGTESVLAVLRAVYDGADSRPAIASRSLTKSTQSTAARLKSRLTPDQLEDIQVNFKRCTRLGLPRPRVTTPEEVFEPDNPLTLADWNAKKEQWRKDRCEEVQAIEARCRLQRKEALGIVPQLAPTGTSTTMVVHAGVPEPSAGSVEPPVAAAAATPAGQPRQVSPAAAVSPIPLSLSPTAAGDREEVVVASQLVGLQQGGLDRRIDGYSVDPAARELELLALSSDLWKSAARAPTAVEAKPSPTAKSLSLSNMMAFEENWASPWLFGAAGVEGSTVTMLNLKEGLVMPVFFMKQPWLTVRRAGVSYSKDGGHGLFADKPFFKGDDIMPYFGIYDADADGVNDAYLLGTMGKQLTDGRGTVAGYINSVRYGQNRKRARDSGVRRPEPNATISKVAIELVRGSKKRVFVIRASGTIARGDEILLSYNHFARDQVAVVEAGASACED